MNSTDDYSQLKLRDVQQRFDRAADRFDDVDFVHAVTRDGLFARLAPMVIEARIIVDLGSATGSGSRLLARHFRRAHVISVDLSQNMLRACRSKQSWFSKPSAVQANAAALPFANQSVDFVFANLLLPWIDEPGAVFSEIARVLRKDGLLLFSTLGPDSLLELRRAWQAADPHAHVNRFLDMHDLGDAAVRSGLRDPVLDVDRLSVTYDSAAALFRDLTAMGARNSLRQRNRSLVSKSRFALMTSALDGAGKNGILSLDLELVYGHCWGSGSRARAAEYRIDPTAIGLRDR